MPSRPPAQPLPSASSSSIIHPSHAAEIALPPLFAQLTFHVLPAKLDGELGKVYAWIEELGGRCVALNEAGFVVTALKGRARLEKILGRGLMGRRVVSTDFVHEAYERALRALDPHSLLGDEIENENEVPALPPWRGFLVVKPVGPEVPTMIDSDSESAGPGDEDDSGRPRKRRRQIRGSLGRGTNPFERGVEGEPVGGLRDMSPFPEDVDLGDVPRRCVERPSPLVCVNQDIIDAIRPIYEDREFEELAQKNSNVLSYRRSMSILKALPRRIRSGKEARKLVDVGEKVAQRIDEFIDTGQITESREILASERYRLLREFASVYTVGHHTARDLYDRHHCRSLEDVRQHYINIGQESEEVRLKEKMRRRMGGRMTHVDIVEEWMRLKGDLDTKISREEVEEIRDCVAEHLGVLLEGCEMTITGGYRRGKLQSSDVDLVFCPPSAPGVTDLDIGLLKRLYLRLCAFGIITHVLHVTHREPGTPVHAAPNNFDNLDKAFVIFKLPGAGRLHRRVDLISAPRERYAAAVLSWSGSMMFERDLKRHAEDMGYKFRAGMIRIEGNVEIHLETEREIFAFLGLRFVPPHLRNADG